MSGFCSKKSSCKSPMMLDPALQRCELGKLFACGPSASSINICPVYEVEVERALARNKPQSGVRGRFETAEVMHVAILLLYTGYIQFASCEINFFCSRRFQSRFYPCD